ncbi:HesB/IscA family protein [Paenibacillus sp. GCM10027626]|uniref:HesB/IscA family protein n=1 Tax=Paenibacillus sp. GCM10027626 TaxID=3273411 RepID=UPI00362DB45A
MKIEISDMAAEKINEMLEQNEMADMYLRIGVEDGGCSGLSYNMKFDDSISEGDQVIEQRGVKVVVDEASGPYLDGLKVDFLMQGMTGGFTMDNPNAKFSCGCGASFRTANYKGTPKKC